MHLDLSRITRCLVQLMSRSAAHTAHVCFNCVRLHRTITTSSIVVYMCVNDISVDAQSKSTYAFCLKLWSSKAIWPVESKTLCFIPPIHAPCSHVVGIGQKLCPLLEEQFHCQSDTLSVIRFCLCSLGDVEGMKKDKIKGVSTQK